MNFLNDAQWTCITDLILAINSIDKDPKFREVILAKLRILIPYESAAFFLSDASKNLPATSKTWQASTPFFMDPIGVDVPVKALDEYISKYSSLDFINLHNELEGPRVFRESDMVSPADKMGEYYQSYLEGRYVLNCSLFDKQDFLGSFNLNRRREDGDFTDKEVQILRILEPHIANRLSRWHVRADRSSSESAFIHRFGISPREAEVTRCIMKGMSNGDISNALAISSSTTKKHLENIFKKTGVGSRVELIVLIQEYL